MMVLPYKKAWLNKFPKSKYLIRSINVRLKNDLSATINRKIKKDFAL